MYERCTDEQAQKLQKLKVRGMYILLPPWGTGNLEIGGKLKNMKESWAVVTSRQKQEEFLGGKGRGGYYFLAQSFSRSVCPKF